MNSSGGPIFNCYKNLKVQDIFQLVKETDLIVVHDQLELDPGIIKLKIGGSHKGHNGLKSIIQTTGFKDFQRIQIGIGRPDSKEPEIVSNYVLNKFSQKEKELFQQKSLDELYLLLKNMQCI